MLTTEQRATLKAFVEADPTLNQIPKTYDGAYALADALKVEASPAFIVWKTSVTQDEIMQNGFDWVRVDNLSVGKARIWEWLFDNQSATCNPSKINVRSGIDECWKGTAADLAVRAAVYVHCKRKANLLEKLFAVGTGSDASPATMAIEGSVSYQEVYEAMGW
ncbi:MAG: hypothetical protein MUE59_03615 [Thiobacillaceae bacterium]|jgi:hypothetical protein|nr:hypothetical protein [Thiobacillaceae bacterium]